MKKAFLMVAATAAMLATGFTACKSNPPQPPKEIDIYVAGSDESGAISVAKVWKNGNELYALTDGSKEAYAGSVFVIDGDVYTAGSEKNNKNWVAKVWKNGKELYAFNDGSTNSAEALSIFVADDKVYTVGYESNIAKLWKNKIAIDLANGSSKGEGEGTAAVSVFVAGNKVYTAGYVTGI